MTIQMKEYENEYKQPWKQYGLTEEQWRRPMAELPEDHRKLIFDILNSKWGLSFTPETFNIKSQPKQKSSK